MNKFQAISILAVIALFFISGKAFLFSQTEERKAVSFPSNSPALLQENPFSLTDPFGLQSPDNKLSIFKATAVVSPLGTVIIPDTVVVYSTNDTTRYIFSVDEHGWFTWWMTQRLVNGQWTDDSRDTYTRDADGRVLLLKSEIAQDGWVNLTQNTYTYDGAGNMLTTLYQQWSSGAWMNISRSTMTYDADGNVLVTTSQNWQNDWTNTDRETQTYDDQGRLASYITEEWKLGLWVKSSAIIESYDDTGLYHYRILQQWSDTGWVNQYRLSSNRNAEGKEVSGTSETWTDNAWVNSTRNTYTYDDSGNMTDNLGESWVQDAWKPSYRYERTYDNGGHILTNEYDQWTGSVWLSTGRTTNTYNDDGSRATVLSEKWQVNEWVPGGYNLVLVMDNDRTAVSLSGFQFIFHQATITTQVADNTSVLPQSYQLSQNYPNPFNPSTTIRYSLPASSIVSLKVYNILGQLVANLVDSHQSTGWHEATWNANISSGIYFYRIDAASASDPAKRFSEVRKMMLLK